MFYTLVNMEMTILEEKENKFFNTKELKIKVKHTGMQTPPKADVVKEIASKYGVDGSRVVVNYIFSVKGLGESFGKAKVLGEKNETQTGKTA